MKDNHTRKPDIAFWFDKNEPNMYIVETSGKLLHVQLIQASFDLLAKAIKADDDCLLGEYEREE